MERIGKLYGEIAQIQSVIDSGYAEDVEEAKADIRELEAEIDRIADELETAE